MCGIGSQAIRRGSDGKGKGLIGALNYLSGKGRQRVLLSCPTTLAVTATTSGRSSARDDKLHWDCSKLDQWGIVFDHATAKGLYLHFKMQEKEMDDNRRRR